MRSINNHPLIVLFVVLAVTGTIAFFTIYAPKFSFPSLSNTSTQNKNSAQNEDEQNQLTNIVPTAVAASRRSDYSVQLLDSKTLVNLYSSLNVWNKTYSGKDTKPLHTLVVYLTDKPQSITQKDDKGNVAYSYSTDYEKDVLVLSVYLPDEALKGPAPSAFLGAAVTLIGSKIGGTNKTIPQITNNNLISTIFNVTAIPTPPNKK